METDLETDVLSFFQGHVSLSAAVIEDPARFGRCCVSSQREMALSTHSQRKVGHGTLKNLQASQDAQVSCLPGMWDFYAETGTVPGKQGQAGHPWS